MTLLLSQPHSVALAKASHFFCGREKEKSEAISIQASSDIGQGLLRISGSSLRVFQINFGDQIHSRNLAGSKDRLCGRLRRVARHGLWPGVLRTLRATARVSLKAVLPLELASGRGAHASSVAQNKNKHKRN